MRRSAFTRIASRPARSRFSRTRASRSGSSSTAMSSASPAVRCAMCRVLPPGAAQASSTRMPGCASSNGAASCAPPSCTDTAPVSKPGRTCTGAGRSSTTASRFQSTAVASRPIARSERRKSSVEHSAGSSLQHHGRMLVVRVEDLGRALAPGRAAMPPPATADARAAGAGFRRPPPATRARCATNLRSTALTTPLARPSSNTRLASTAR